MTQSCESIMFHFQIISSSQVGSCVENLVKFFLIAG